MAPQRRDDPTLPAPWQALYEPTQNATYYWNPTTNITQYERPSAAAAAPAPYSSNGYGGGGGGGGYSNGGGGYSNGYAQGNAPAAEVAPGSNGVGEYGVLSTAPKNYRMTNAEYCAENGLVLQGEQPLPEAYQTFESVGFPQDIMDEVRVVPPPQWRCGG